jgi:predicted protein tyrosine phosphatase
MSYRNRMGNAKNEYQTDIKKVLCVCSAGLLRSPTMAVVLSQEPYNFNTRAAGISQEYALIVVDDVLLHWADEIVVAEDWMKEELAPQVDKPVYSLQLPDIYEYRHPELMKLIKERYDDALRDT